MNRKLDIKIAKIVFGWRYISVGSDANGESAGEILFSPDVEPTSDHYNQLPRVGKVSESWFVPHYSSGMRDAIRLAKHVELPLSVASMPVTPEPLAEMAFNHYVNKLQEEKFPMRNSLEKSEDMKERCKEYEGKRLRDLLFKEQFDFNLSRDWYAVWHCPDRFEIVG